MSWLRFRAEFLDGARRHYIFDLANDFIFALRNKHIYPFIGREFSAELQLHVIA